MSILEVLENYHDLQLQNISGVLAGDLQHKMNVLEVLFDDDSSFSFSGDDGIEILKLHYKHGMSYERIAEKLHLSVRTVYRKRKNELFRLQRYAFKEI